MCPSYRATGEEQHSTRGRAHLLWEMLAGALRDEGFQSQAVHEALDLCLSCKACKSECPVQVDMAAYKSEFLAQRYKGRLHPLHHYIFGFADRLARYGSLAPALTNAILTGPLTSPLIKRIAGVAQARQLPRLARKSYQSLRESQRPVAPSFPQERVGNDEPPSPSASTAVAPSFPQERVGNDEPPSPSASTAVAPSFRQERVGNDEPPSPSASTAVAPSFPQERVGNDEPPSPSASTAVAPSFPQERVGNDEPPSPSARKVLLWPDTWNNYYHPQSLSAAETVLTQAGFQVETPQGHICCGRPLYDFGLLTAARSYLAKVLRRMAPQIEAGLPFVFLEPSCASVFKDELLELFPSDPRAQRLSRQVWLLADFLASRAPEFASNFVPGRLQGAHILLHGHCHHKAVFGGPASEIALLRQAGATVEPIQAGCCGMAGPFGFEADKFEVSKTIANDGLLPALQSAAPTAIVVADGFSCREQIDQLAHVRALHFAEVLARACGCGK